MLCKICGYQPNSPSRSFDTLFKHINIHNRIPLNERQPVRNYTSEYSPTCLLCGFYAADERNLNIHVDKHFLKTSNPFVCDICYATFDAKSSLISHQSVHRSKDVE